MRGIAEATQLKIDGELLKSWFFVKTTGIPDDIEAEMSAKVVISDYFNAKTCKLELPEVDDEVLVDEENGEDQSTEDTTQTGENTTNTENTENTENFPLEQALVGSLSLSLCCSAVLLLYVASNFPLD